jgi:very-short-patch-repair endonuclease
MAGSKPRFSPVAIDAQVSMGGSRFDFLMLVEIGDSDLMIAVECDGAGFHDEVKDYYRDRNWKRSNIHTIRLSGSDIDRNPRMAASRVAEFVLQQMVARGLA